MKRNQSTPCQIVNDAITIIMKSKTYPAKPVFEPEPNVLVQQGSEKFNAKCVLREVNSQWTEKYGHTFSEVLPKLCPEAKLIQKKAKLEIKREKRNALRNCPTL